MKIGIIYSQQGTNVNYRGLWAAQALGRRGHSVLLAPVGQNRAVAWERLADCDVVHVYRLTDPPIAAAVEALRARGVAISWDIDDDMRVVPREAPNYQLYGGLKGTRAFSFQLKMMRRAHVVTTTTETLAERFRATGHPEVITIDNYLDASQFGPPAPHDGIVIGWTAAGEHRADVVRLKITDMLREVMDRDPRVRVVTMGLRLKLDPSRYSFDPGVPLEQLASHMRRFDVGIAPISDIPFNLCRSNVKVKEYAAASVPWLASARGPYAGLDSRYGGITLADDQWVPALLALASSSEKREALRFKGTGWASTQRLDFHLDKWLSVWSRAAALAGRPAQGAGPAAVPSSGKGYKVALSITKR